MTFTISICVGARTGAQQSVQASAVLESPEMVSTIVEASPTPTPPPPTSTPKPAVVAVDPPSGEEEIEEIAKVTAYSCGGLTTEAEIRMNCPSLLSGQPRTATGSVPVPLKTVACDRKYLHQQFEIEGVGIVICTDTGGAIKGAGRFDLYVETVQEARQFGVKNLSYKVI